MLHDYHLYTAPRVIRQARPDALPPPLHPHPVDAAGRVAGAAARHARGHLRGAPLQRHRRLPHARLPAQLPALLPRAVRPRRRRGGGRRVVRGPRGVGARVPAADLRGELLPQGAARRGARVRARDPAPPARPPDPARRPRRPVEERAARLHRVRPLPRAAPRVPRAGHVHRAADALAAGRARVRRVPGEDRGARRGREPPPRHDRLDADRPAARGEPRPGDRRLQALRPPDRQRDVRRDEPGGEGGAARERAPRRVAPVGEHGRARGARRVLAVGQPVRRAGAGRRDVPRAHDVEPRSARGAPRA